MSFLDGKVKGIIPVNKVVFKGQCLDNNDPKRLGRIRAILKTENSTEREESNPLKEYEKWSSKDPLVFKPLLPWFFNAPPKEGEYIHLFYSNIDRKGSKDKYYISGVFSHPTLSFDEPYDSAVLETDEGSQSKEMIPLLDQQGNYKKNVEGVYGEPDDISIYGRGTCDLIIRDNTVILRAGKQVRTQPNNLPVINDRRSFLQLSNFDTETTYGNPKKWYKFNFQTKPIKKLIEYNIINPENEENQFSGHIDIYQLSLTSITSQNITVTTPIDSSFKSKQTIVRFTNLSIDQAAELTIKTIKGVLSGNLSEIKTLGFNSVIIGEDNQFTQENFDLYEVYPLFFRPNELLYKVVNEVNVESNLTAVFNASTFINKIKIKEDLTPGHSLVYNNALLDSTPFKLEVEKTIDKKINLKNHSVSILGGDELYFISHQSTNPVKESIDITNSMLGFNETQISDDMQPKTSSMVRGEELQQFLRLVVNFLSSHVHPWHGMPPNSVGLDGTRLDDILKELELSSEKILNKYIRIN